MKEKTWFAVMSDVNDDDWGTGSFDLETAKEMARGMGKDAYIAVIADGRNPVCIGTITDLED